MINENIGFNPDAADNSIINPEQESIEQDIKVELEQLAYGLDDIKGSLEKLDPNNNTPAYVKAVKKIWEGYKQIESATNMVLMMYGATAVGAGAYKMVEQVGVGNNGVTQLVTGVAALSLAIAGFIHEDKKRTAKLDSGTYN